MSAIAETRADLDLHISLLSEHETTRLLQLVSRVAENLNIAEGRARLDCRALMRAAEGSNRFVQILNTRVRVAIRQAR